MCKLPSVIKGVDWIEFEVHGDERGSLVAIENDKNIDFSIKRVYYIYDTKSEVVRGKHAHKNLNQILLCISGSCDILVDNGIERQVVNLNEKNKGIYIHGFVWREMMNFSANAVLLALVDQGYDTEDYVYDIEMVRREAENKE